MVRRYEVLFLTVPEITSDEANMLEKQFDKAVIDAKGTILSYERWGKYKLAYPIRRYEYGIYYLMRFDVNDEKKAAILDMLKTFFGVKYVDLIMRHRVASLDPQGSLDYKRPESLEEVPTKDIDTFLKESKSFLATAPAAAPVSAPAPQEPAPQEELKDQEHEKA